MREKMNLKKVLGFGKNRSSDDQANLKVINDNFETLKKYISAAKLLEALLTVDGTGSGLDADTLDGKHNGEVDAISIRGYKIYTMTPVVYIGALSANSGDYRFTQDIPAGIFTSAPLGAFVQIVSPDAPYITASYFRDAAQSNATAARIVVSTTRAISAGNRRFALLFWGT
jgi:hypothetical protein